MRSVQKSRDTRDSMLNIDFQVTFARSYLSVKAEEFHVNSVHVCKKLTQHQQMHYSYFIRTIFYVAATCFGVIPRIIVLLHRDQYSDVTFGYILIVHF